MDRIRAELAEIAGMTPEYVAANGGEAMRRLGASDWLAEETLLLVERKVPCCRVCRGERAA